MKINYFLTFTLLLSSANSFAANLSCWNLYAKHGSKPLVTALIISDNELQKITVNQDDNSQFSTKGISISAKGTVISSAHRGPYIGYQEFVLASGINLVLPKSLNKNDLAQTVISAGNLPANLATRQNGVLDVSGNRVSQDQGGDSYYRMHCIAE